MEVHRGAELMAGGLAVISQANFFAGAHPGLELIADGSRRYHYMAGAEDIVNGLVGDDGIVFRRGGCASLTTAAVSGGVPAVFANVAWAGYLPGRATLLTITGVYDAAGDAYVLSAPATAPSSLSTVYTKTGGTPGASSGGWSQPVEVSGMLAFIDQTSKLYVYGGATSDGPAGVTVTLTAGSRSVSMASTTGVAVGHLLRDVNGISTGVVETVDDSTHVTINRTWEFATGTGVVDFVAIVAFDLKHQQPQLLADRLEVIGAGANRLWVAQRNRVFFSTRDNPITYTADDYHELPFGARVLGIRGLGTSVLIFTTQGLWVDSNAEYDLSDPSGNPLQSLNQVDPEFLLWGQRGIAAWDSALVVPGTQDVLLVDGVSSMRPVTGGISKTYRSYVKAGYQVGSASVFRGFYVLPVLDGQTVVDVLVCNLAQTAWSRWNGQAAGSAFASFAQDTATSPAGPRLYGLSANAIVELTGCFDPVVAHTADADGTQHALMLTGRTLTLGGTGTNTWREARLAYELAGSGTVTAEIASGPPGSAFTALSGAAGAAADGAKRWTFARQARAFRPRFTSTGAPSKLVIRSIDVGAIAHQQV